MYKMGNGELGRTEFNSFNKYMLSIIEYNETQSYYTILFKGAPEIIWALCTHIIVRGINIKITQEHEKQFQKINNLLGSQGESILGMA